MTETGRTQVDDPPSLLAVAAMPPWPVEDGYALRVANFLEQLAKTWNVTLVSPPPSAGAEVASPEAIEWRPVEGIPATTTLPWRDERPRLVTEVASLLGERAYDRALLWNGTEFLGGEIADFPPSVADRIDCGALQAWRNRRHSGDLLGKLRMLRRALEMALYERRIMGTFENVAVTGPDDARALRRITGHPRVTVVPNGVDLPPLEGLPPEGDRPRVIFTGVMGFGPNVAAARYFADEVWPEVRSRVPEAEFVIAGRAPSPDVKALSEEEGISLRPDVPDLTDEIREAWAAVAPMQTGSGIKNKVLEAWAAERPVVLSELATNGLDLTGEDGEAMRSLVCRDAGEMADAVVGLFRDRPRRQALGRAARDLAERRHSWDSAGERLSRLLPGPGLMHESEAS